MLDFQVSPTLPRFAFGEYDEVIMDGISYRAIDRDDFGFVFVRTDSTGVAESFTHQELSRRVMLGKLEHRRNAFLPETAKRRLKNPSLEISTRSLKQQQKPKYHESLVRGFREMEAEGKVRRTVASVEAVLPAIKIRAGRYLSVPSEGDEGAAGGNTMIVPMKISASRLLKRVAAFDRDGMSALYGRSANGSRSRRIAPDELALMSKTVQNFLTMEKPTVAQVVEDVRDAFIAENRLPKDEGKPLLIMPWRETIRHAVRSLDPFLVDIARFGLDEARKRNAPVGKGLELTRPLERVEMDEWKVDLLSLMAQNGLWSVLSDEEKASLGYEEGKKPRWYLTAAICAAIRYHSEALARWFMHSTSREVRVRWYSEDLGAVAVELNGEWIEVPSVFERFQGQRAQTWIMAVREIQASVAAQKKVDEDVIFNAMNRIREIHSNSMARIGLMVEDYSKERIASLEDGMLIGLNVDEAQRDAKHLPNTNMGLELPTSEHYKTRDASGVNITAVTSQAESEANDVPWTMDEK